jgi:hypothetical protein
MIAVERGGRGEGWQPLWVCGSILMFSDMFAPNRVASLPKYFEVLE